MTTNPVTGYDRMPALPAPGRRAGFGGAVRSEWTKIRSLRSTVWTLGAAMLVTIGISVLGSWGQARSTDETAAQLARTDLVQRSLFGIILGQLIMVVFGALTITSEYSTGMIRTSMTVQPRRMNLLWAKLLMVSTLSFVVGEIISFVSFLINSSFWRAKGVSLSLSTPHALSAVIGGGLFLTGAAVLAFGLGVMLRNTAAVITSGVGLLFVVSILADFLPKTWQNHLDKWLPLNAGDQVWSTMHVPGTDLGQWTGFLVFMLYGIVAVALGVLLFKRRDA
jgi:ABC-type transport system involved in multi-copper enzyme maturation permease subunit